MSTRNLSIMYSGGLDSYIAYHYAKANLFNPELVYVNLGHPYVAKEKAACDKNGLPYKELNFSDLFPLIEGKLTNQIIPFRNLFLGTIGAMLNPRIWICALEGEQHGKEHDKSHRFFNDTTELFTFVGDFFQEDTIIETPFSHMTKADTIAWAIKSGVSVENMLNTSSCYHPEVVKCGQCLTCVKRHMAFLLNDIEEYDFEIDNPWNSDYMDELLREIPKANKNNDYSRFTKPRVEEFYEYAIKLKEHNIADVTNYL